VWTERADASCGDYLHLGSGHFSGTGHSGHGRMRHGSQQLPGQAHRSRHAPPATAGEWLADVLAARRSLENPGETIPVRHGCPCENGQCRESDSVPLPPARVLVSSPQELALLIQGEFCRGSDSLYAVRESSSLLIPADHRGRLERPPIDWV
jgi:hypothetical protein